ncbi:hypothetical protein [Thauera propionica]|uniref:hypothetical protein n=1 Tax=Thauera propionica TaxID=2019431 RepID=UPI0023F48F64|nr:hypothetical protein [Thauera propionica]MDD3676082.1 hypothetical protein [Thauera propionica]
MSNALRLFLDTEFTSFTRPRLISFALVAETGESLYLEHSEVPGVNYFGRSTSIILAGGSEA